MKSTALPPREGNQRLLKSLFVTAAMSCLAGCRTDTVDVGKPKLDFQKERFPPHLTVILANSTTQEMRIWKPGNSWGWGNILVDLRERPGGPIFVAKRKSRDWTINGPGFNSIAPGKDRKLEINLDDGWWEIPDGVNLLKRSYQVRVRFRVPPSPEAKKLGVFVGRISSGWK